MTDAPDINVINDALGILAECEVTAAELSTGSGEPARVMAAGWPAAVDFCLSLAPWRFATRTQQLAYLGSLPNDDPAAYAAPAYTRAYAIPDDHLRTNWLRSNPQPGQLPVDFVMQDGFWHTNTESLYVSYVSHQYRPATSWTPMFSRTVAAYLAWQKGPRIRPATDQNELRLSFETTLDACKTVDASETPFSWHAPGRLVRSRGGGRNWREQGCRW